MTTKLHPSIVITTSAYGTDCEVAISGTTTFKGSRADTYEYASGMSNTLWSIEVSERPLQARPQRIWDEEGYTYF